MKSLLTINQLQREDIESILAQAQTYRETPPRGGVLPSFITGVLFFEESTRTRLGFESAVYRLGGNVLRIFEPKSQVRMGKAESLEDTVKVLLPYCDIAVIRSMEEDLIYKVEKNSSTPIINAANGFAEHPTQALLDLFAIQTLKGTVDNTRIAIVGDLRFMRSPHSLALALAKFSAIELRCISPEELRLPVEYREKYLASGNLLSESTQFDVSGVDIVYMAGFTPHSPVGDFNDETRHQYQLNAQRAQDLESATYILCPLPRIDEITEDVDSLPNAKYFFQNELGQFVRMAVLKYCLT